MIRDTFIDSDRLQVRIAEDRIGASLYVRTRPAAGGRWSRWELRDIGTRQELLASVQRWAVALLFEPETPGYACRLVVAA